MRIKLKDSQPFAMAGLWERWQSNEGLEINSCSVITTSPNKLMKDIHDRMPAILKPENEHIWLDRSIEDTSYLKQFLIPYNHDMMEVFEVSSEVNSPANDSALGYNK